MAFAYWLMWSKGGYDSGGEAVAVGVLGAIIGLTLAYATEQPQTLTAARLKLAYWPLALLLFVTYPTIGIWLEDRANGSSGAGWLWMPFAVAAGIGFLFGLAHFLIASRKLRRRDQRAMQPA